MKLATVGLALALLILPAACSSQSKTVVAPVGYDLGSCNNTDFFGLHLKAVGNDMLFDMSNPEAGVVEVQKDPDLLKFQKEDKEGRHYISPSGEVEIILTRDTNTKNFDVFGFTIIKGKIWAVLFGLEGDGSKLAERGYQFQKVCQGLQNMKSDNVPTPTLN